MNLYQQLFVAQLAKQIDLTKTNFLLYVVRLYVKQATVDYWRLWIIEGWKFVSCVILNVLFTWFFFLLQTIEFPRNWKKDNNKKTKLIFYNEIHNDRAD